MGAAVATAADLAIVTSDNPRTENPQKIIETILDGLFSKGWQQVDISKLANIKKRSFSIIQDASCAHYCCLFFFFC